MFEFNNAVWTLDIIRLCIHVGSNLCWESELLDYTESVLTDNQRKSSEKVDWICNYLLIMYRYSNVCPESLLRVAVCAKSFLEKWLVILLKRAVNKSWESLTRHYWRNKQQSDQCKILSDGVPIGSGTFATILGGINIWNPWSHESNATLEDSACTVRVLLFLLIHTG